jgi:hypothetical protein
MGCHGLALYDAIRLYVKSILSAGVGGDDFSIQIDTKGLDFVGFLPKGMGEACSVRMAHEEKLNRANQRRQEALAALERERLRREVSEEEKARLRREKIEAVQLERDLEEKQLFDMAYLALTEYRENISTTSKEDYSEVLQMWRQVGHLKESRYPYTLKSVICHLNTAIVLLELEIENEGAAQREAGALVKKALGQLMHVLMTTFPIKRIVQESDFDEGFKGIDFPDNEIPCYLQLLQNCLTLLKVVGDQNTLSHSNDTVMCIGFLDEILSQRERDCLYVERAMFGMVIFPVDDMLGEMAETLLEFNQVREMEHKRKALEIQLRLDAEQRAAAESREETLEERMKRLREEKEEEKAQRKEDRIRLARTRNKLYGMIQSDAISTLFKIKSKSVANRFGQDDPDVDDPFEEEGEEEEEEESAGSPMEDYAHDGDDND